MFEVAVAVLPSLLDLLGEAQAIRGAAGGGRFDGGEALVEQDVKFLGQDDSVLHVVADRAQVRLDVGRVQDRLGVLARDRALVAVGLQQTQTKGALALAIDTRGFARAASIDVDGHERRGQFFGGRDPVAGDRAQQKRNVRRAP